MASNLSMRGILFIPWVCAPARLYHQIGFVSAQTWLIFHDLRCPPLLLASVFNHWFWSSNLLGYLSTKKIFSKGVRPFLAWPRNITTLTPFPVNGRPSQKITVVPLWFDADGPAPLNLCLKGQCFTCLGWTYIKRLAFVGKHWILDLYQLRRIEVTLQHHKLAFIEPTSSCPVEFDG